MNSRIVKRLLGGGLLGLLLGAPWQKVARLHQVLRGALFGLLVSFSFYVATGFSDVISFLAGIVYGVVLEIYLSHEQ